MNPEWDDKKKKPEKIPVFKKARIGIIISSHTYIHPNNLQPIYQINQMNQTNLKYFNDV